MRINRYLASCGVASRRKSEELIISGKVKVNGVVVTDLATDINEEKDKVTVSGRPVQLKTGNVYYMLNKPAGVISASSSDHGDKTVIDMVDSMGRRLFPVGRLDKETEGLIFITDDGDFAYRMTHPKFEKEKQYIAVLTGNVDDRDIKKLSKGVLLDGRNANAKAVRKIENLNGDSLIDITISEGRNRQIRRMCEIIGHPVKSLKRIREGSISLGNLGVGEYRELNASEVKRCLSETGRSETNHIPREIIAGYTRKAGSSAGKRRGNSTDADRYGANRPEKDETGKAGRKAGAQGTGKGAYIAGAFGKRPSKGRRSPITDEDGAKNTRRLKAGSSKRSHDGDGKKENRLMRIAVRADVMAGKVETHMPSHSSGMSDSARGGKTEN